MHCDPLCQIHRAVGQGGLSVARETRPRVLVVEDERVVAWDLREMINALGYDCYAVASSAEEALRVAAGACPDLVLMDIRIKGPVDGIETAKLLQREYGSRIRIVFLSAHSKTDLRERAREVEVSAWMTKPIHAPVLQRTLAQVFASSKDVQS
jgi:CheY-like chemotaxis protein